jgi:hypothetical protein
VIVCKSIGDVNDENFDLVTKMNSTSEIISVILFQSKECAECTEAERIFEKTFEKVKSEKLKFFKLDCFSSIYTCLRFNISRLPVILVLENGYVYQGAEYLTDNSFFRFLQEEKSPQSGRPIPPPYGYFNIFFKSLDDIFQNFNDFMRKQLRSKLKIKFQWENFHSIMLILILILVLTIFECFFLFCCLKKKKLIKKTTIDDGYSVSDYLESKCS